LARKRPESYSDWEIRMEPIRVIYHHEPEGWWAESPDVRGWMAVGETYVEVLELTKEGIPFALERDVDDVELEHYVPADEHLAA
jgi:predicted RNase H-like HicB family nuclease